MNIKVGDIAPDFETLDHKGNKISLSKLRGKPVVLYFYPKDFTSGCTTEANEFKDHYDEFKNTTLKSLGFQLIRQRHIRNLRRNMGFLLFWAQTTPRR